MNNRSNWLWQKLRSIFAENAPDYTITHEIGSSSAALCSFYRVMLLLSLQPCVHDDISNISRDIAVDASRYSRHARIHRLIEGVAIGAAGHAAGAAIASINGRFSTEND